MNATAVVIGASGLVGKALVNQLAKADHIAKVVTLTRRPCPHPSAKVDNRTVNFEQLDDHAADFCADLVFSCLGTTRKQAGSLQAQRRVDVDYQLKAAQLAHSKGVNHYLLVSSSGASSGSRNAYLRMKGELEEAVIGLGFARVSLFQPSLLLGQREKRRLGEAVAGKVLPVLCKLPGLQRYRPITGEQLAAKMVQVSATPGPGVERFVLDENFV